MSLIKLLHLLGYLFVSLFLATIVQKVKMADPPEDKKRKEMTELQLFDELFPVLVEDLTKNGMKDDEITSAIEWFKEVSLLIVCI